MKNDHEKRKSSRIVNVCLVLELKNVFQSCGAFVFGESCGETECRSYEPGYILKIKQQQQQHQKDERTREFRQQQ